MKLPLTPARHSYLLPSGLNCTEFIVPKEPFTRPISSFDAKL